MRRAVMACLTLALMFVGLSLGRASDVDETSVTVQVSSAEHEIQEGYFTLGENATIMVKPGSDLYNFLARQRGQKVKIVFSEQGGRTLSRLDR